MTRQFRRLATLLTVTVTRAARDKAHNKFLVFCPKRRGGGEGGVLNL